MLRFIKIWQKSRVIYTKNNTSLCLWLYFPYFLEWKIFHTKFVEKIKPHILYWLNLYFWKWYSLLDNVENYCTARQVTDDSMGQVYYMLENYGHKRTFRTCDTYCFAIASMVERTSFIVTLYVYCLYCEVLILTSTRRNSCHYVPTELFFNFDNRPAVVTKIFLCPNLKFRNIFCGQVTYNPLMQAFGVSTSRSDEELRVAVYEWLRKKPKFVFGWRFQSGIRRALDCMTWTQPEVCWEWQICTCNICTGSADTFFF